ncbi:DUF4123 domain-containing protein [Alkalilimnicola ehrlichii MLHE-1]|uniref:DUF4123 domain-containing protein n=1 Tax=Alkalilimnicola ehrlichii (strain ATCC BAA-1101 / DSM 17681 / MLHE-1) TaxID=187272 RepID=Q0AAY4_ALKEH|nr:DUF4123 domain-containing protein [Alkalilimnicola ehrlichii]ABI56003.1 hypothetical protein Mlg_0649 [Alkalilimnicola ehrlichii MLHE-1]
MAITRTPENGLILLDGATTDAPRLAYQHDDAPELERLFAGTRHQEAITVSPCLVKPSPGSALLATPETWRDHGILLESPADPAVVADHLRSLISVRLPSGQGAYCRFYSPGQLVPLLCMLDYEERRAFSGPITAWHLPGTDITIRAPSQGQARGPRDEGWFQLSEAHMTHLRAQACWLFRVAVARASGLAGQPGGQHRCARLIERAQRYRFHDEPEIARFVALVAAHEARLEEKDCLAVLLDVGQPSGKRIRTLERLVLGGAR